MRRADWPLCSNKGALANPILRRLPFHQEATAGKLTMYRQFIHDKVKGFRNADHVKRLVKKKKNPPLLGSGALKEPSTALYIKSEPSKHWALLYRRYIAVSVPMSKQSGYQFYGLV